MKITLEQRLAPSTHKIEDILSGIAVIITTPPHNGWEVGDIVVKSGDTVANLSSNQWDRRVSLNNLRVRRLQKGESITITEE